MIWNLEGSAMVSKQGRRVAEEVVAGPTICIATEVASKGASSNERRVGVLGKRAAAFDGLRHDAIVRLGGCEGRAGGDRAHGASGQPACLAGG